jgi:hypothetical protein
VLVSTGVKLEMDALRDRNLYLRVLLLLAAAAALAFWRTRSNADPLEFEDQIEPTVHGLGLYRDGTLPIEEV